MAITSTDLFNNSANYAVNQNDPTNIQDPNKANNDRYLQFMQSLPQFQHDLTNQAVDQGAQGYNEEKSTIDKSANRRGLLYSGLKQGAEQGAANKAANQTQGQIAKQNADLSDYASGYGTQVAQSNAAKVQSDVSAAMNRYKDAQAQHSQNQQGIGQLLQGIGTGAALYAASDKNLKNDIKSGDRASQDMIDKLESKSFSYKDDPDKKQQLGIIAQDLEKSPMGKAIVVDTPKGKHIDIAKALSAVLAVQSVMNKRLNKAGA